jgi:hypothetical protein
MQTFLPYRDFAATAGVLDRARLGKQRVETMQIMKAFTRTSGGWINHPAVKMWRGYAWALREYQYYTIEEWTKVRGYKDTCLGKTFKIYRHLPKDMKSIGLYPPWLLNEELFISHQSNLIRKKPDHYQLFWPEVPNNLEYVWPV